MWPSLLELLPLKIGRSNKISNTLLLLYGAAMLLLFGWLKHRYLVDHPRRSYPVHFVFGGAIAALVTCRHMNHSFRQSIPLLPAVLYRLTPLTGEQDYLLCWKKRLFPKALGTTVGLAMLFLVWRIKADSPVVHYSMGVLAVMTGFLAYQSAKATQLDFLYRGLVSRWAGLEPYWKPDWPLRFRDVFTLRGFFWHFWLLGQQLAVGVCILLYAAGMISLVSTLLMISLREANPVCTLLLATFFPFSGVLWLVAASTVPLPVKFVGMTGLLLLSRWKIRRGMAAIAEKEPFFQELRSRSTDNLVTPLLAEQWIPGVDGSPQEAEAVEDDDLHGPPMEWEDAGIPVQDYKPFSQPEDLALERRRLKVTPDAEVKRRIATLATEWIVKVFLMTLLCLGAHRVSASLGSSPLFIGPILFALGLLNVFLYSFTVGFAYRAGGGVESNSDFPMMEPAHLPVNAELWLRRRPWRREKQDWFLVTSSIVIFALLMPKKLVIAVPLLLGLLAVLFATRYRIAHSHFEKNSTQFPLMARHYLNYAILAFGTFVIPLIVSLHGLLVLVLPSVVPAPTGGSIYPTVVVWAVTICYVLHAICAEFTEHFIRHRLSYNIL